MTEESENITATNASQVERAEPSKRLEPASARGSEGMALPTNKPACDHVDIDLDALVTTFGFSV